MGFWRRMSFRHFQSEHLGTMMVGFSVCRASNEPLLIGNHPAQSQRAADLFMTETRDHALPVFHSINTEDRQRRATGWRSLQLSRHVGRVTGRGDAASRRTRKYKCHEH